jgi:hypothetical protein
MASAGCAGAPMKVDTSESAYKVARTEATGGTAVSAVVVANKAENGVYNRDGLFGELHFPFIFETTPRQLVEQDVRDFFAQAVKSDPASATRIVVTIKKVDCYGILTAMQATGILGIALAGTERSLVMDISALVEVEESGRVLKSYAIEKRTVIKARTPLKKDLIAAYQKLIATYRLEAFGDLEHSFVERYL